MIRMGSMGGMGTAFGSIIGTFGIIDSGVFVNLGQA